MDASIGMLPARHPLLGTSVGVYKARLSSRASVARRPPTNAGRRRFQGHGGQKILALSSTNTNDAVTESYTDTAEVPDEGRDPIWADRRDTIELAAQSSEIMAQIAEVSRSGAELKSAIERVKRAYDDVEDEDEAEVDDNLATSPLESTFNRTQEIFLRSAALSAQLHMAHLDDESSDTAADDTGAESILLATVHDGNYDATDAASPLDSTFNRTQEILLRSAALNAQLFAATDPDPEPATLAPTPPIDKNAAGSPESLAENSTHPMLRKASCDQLLVESTDIVAQVQKFKKLRRSASQLGPYRPPSEDQQVPAPATEATHTIVDSVTLQQRVSPRKAPGKAPVKAPVKAPTGTPSKTSKPGAAKATVDAPVRGSTFTQNKPANNQQSSKSKTPGKITPKKKSPKVAPKPKTPKAAGAKAGPPSKATGQRRSKRHPAHRAALPSPPRPAGSLSKTTITVETLEASAIGHSGTCASAKASDKAATAGPKEPELAPKQAAFPMPRPTKAVAARHALAKKETDRRKKAAAVENRVNPWKAKSAKSKAAKNAKARIDTREPDAPANRRRSSATKRAEEDARKPKTPSKSVAAVGGTAVMLRRLAEHSAVRRPSIDLPATPPDKAVPRKLSWQATYTIGDHTSPQRPTAKTNGPSGKKLSWMNAKTVDGDRVASMRSADKAATVVASQSGRKGAQETVPGASPQDIDAAADAEATVRVLNMARRFESIVQTQTLARQSSKLFFSPPSAPSQAPRTPNRDDPVRSMAKKFDSMALAYTLERQASQKTMSQPGTPARMKATSVSSTRPLSEAPAEEKDTPKTPPWKVELANRRRKTPAAPETPAKAPAAKPAEPTTPAWKLEWDRRRAKPKAKAKDGVAGTDDTATRAPTPPSTDAALTASQPVPEWKRLARANRERNVSRKQLL